MLLLINDNEVSIDVEFKTEVAPCPGCRFFTKATETEPSVCQVEGRGLSSSLIEDCERLSWRRAF